MSMLDMNDQRALVTPALPSHADAPFVPETQRFADQDGGMRFRQLFDILRRRLRLIASIAICGTLAVVGLALLLPPRYTAKAQIVIEESQTPRIDGRVTSLEAGPDEATIQTQVTALSSHDLLAAVIAQLSADPTFRASQRGGLGSDPDLSVAGKNLLDIEQLERHLNVFQEAGSRVISVAYTAKDPAEAAVIANKITDYYLAAGEDKSRLALDQGVTVLAGKFADLRAESESLEAAVADYQAAHGVKDAAKTNVIDQKLGDLNHQLSTAQSELVARRARHGELLALRGASGDWGPLLAGLDAQGLVDLHSQVLAVLAGRQDSIAVIPHSGEASLQGEAAARSLRDKVRKELDQALLKLSHAENVATAQVAAIEQRLSAVQSASDDVQLRDLVAAAASARHRYERLVQRRDELLEQRDDVTAPARLLSRAAVPDRPSSVNPLLFLAPGGLAFLVIGCLVALLRDRLDQGIYSENDVASALGLRCAGFVPLSRHIVPAEGTEKVPAAATPPFMEALGGIMVSLGLIGPDRRKPQVILVTSSVPGEGKTTLAVSLATCAAQMGAKVLLLDLDARAEAGMSPAPGQPRREETAVEKVYLLARDRAPTDVIPTSPGKRLDYLSVRRGPGAEPTPLFSGDHLSKLLQRQRSSYDLIFIDSAPVLAKAEVRLLAAMADQVVFAVRWGKTRRDDARAALALLRGGGPNGANITATISAAITQVDLERHARGGQVGALAKYGKYSAG
jgi:polysaccharide biosynthesis transport protein